MCFRLVLAFRIRDFCNFSVHLFFRSSTNTRKSYGKMQESSNASNDRTSINLSTVRNSKCIYYNIFGAFLHGQDVEILDYSILSIIYVLHKCIFSLHRVENTLVKVFL